MISIRRQLTRELLLSCLVLLGGGLAAVFFAARQEIVEEFDSALRAKALAVSTCTERDEEGVKVDFSNQYFHGFSGDRPHDYFQLWLETGKSLARSDSLHDADLPTRNGSSDRPRFWNFNLPNGQPVRAISLLFTPRGQEGETPPADAPRLRLTVASNRDDLDEALTELLGIAAGCGVLLLVATWYVVPRVLKRGLQPLDRLGELAAQIDADSLTARFPAAGLPAELQPICGRLNDLLARLEQSFERERRFSADLAHELRTPLAELRTLTECSLKWPESRDPATDRDTLAIAAQMEAVVTTLLALTRGEQGRLAADLQPVALSPLIEESWRPFAARATARQLRAQFHLAPASAQADPALLRSILGNLFDNAVDYAPSGSDITLTLAIEGDSVICTVANPTDNLEAADLSKLFDRFWRKEAARTGGRHFGLGLPLAATFARSMGWTLSANLTPTGLLAFTLRGPAASTPSASA
jgi:two-component system sensor histidine kinase QseC